MKNAPSITHTAAITADNANSAPSMHRAGQRAQRKTGDQHQRRVLGRDIAFTLKRIPHSEIEQRTQVWAGNERIQELLTDAALADLLPSFRTDGQEEPAYGRDLDNDRLETADGSRRRMSAIKTGCDYLIWTADLSDAEMEHISTIGNQYKAPSAYERGCKYQRHLAGGRYSSVNEMSKSLQLDRKTLQRCMDTASLPREIITLYPTVNAISARTGYALARAISPAMIELANNPKFKALAPTQPAEHTTAALLDTNKPTKKEAPARTWNDSALRIDHQDDDSVKIIIGNDVPEPVREKIEQMIRRELGIKEHG